MSFVADRTTGFESGLRTSSSLFTRMAAWFGRAGAPHHHAGRTVIDLDAAPKSMLRDIGLLDGRQVIPLQSESGWR